MENKKDIVGIPEDKRPYCELSGRDGNAYAVIGRVADALRKAGFKEEVATFKKEALSGDYDHLLCVAMSYVKDGSEEDDDEDDLCHRCSGEGAKWNSSGLCDRCDELEDKEDEE